MVVSAPDGGILQMVRDLWRCSETTLRISRDFARKRISNSKVILERLLCAEPYPERRALAAIYLDLGCKLLDEHMDQLQAKRIGFVQRHLGR